MEIIIGALLALALVFVIVVLLRFSAGRRFTDLRNEIAELKAKQLESTNQSLAEQSQFYRSSQEMLTRVHEKLGTLERASQQMAEIGKDVLQLQDILRAPKLRGSLGEFLLEDLLKQVLPAKNYETQYRFGDGAIVDAVVKIGDRLVPIDAKFPLESLQRMVRAGDEAERERERKEFIRSVKKKIDDIAAKYIKEAENTYDFAMMYVPAESVYYEAVIADGLQGRRYEITAHAMERKVILVSPNSLYSYLMAIVLGLRGFRIEQQAKTIMTELSRVQKSFVDFFGDFQLVGKHLKNAATKYDESVRSAERLQDRIGQITGVQAELPEAEPRSRPEGR